tara:strand:+ start:684 stop:1655 length:972 start_codon:yes stop_codon:yes gene_type:complete
MDEIKKVKSLQKIKKYLKSEKFSQKKNIFIKYYEVKERKKISKNIKKICIDEKFFFFQSQSTENILVYDIHENKKFYEFIFIQIFEIKNYSNFTKIKKSKFKFFSNYNQPGLFSILGPEGVGKSTLCSNIQNILKNSPINFDTFHHTGAWKNKDKIKKVQKKIDFKKKVSRIIPRFLKIQIDAFRGEIKYFLNLVKILHKNHNENLITIVDRYSYDRYVRWVNLKKPFFQRIGSLLVCYFLKKPTKCFILVDDPKRIFNRKKIMPVWEIKLHISKLERLCIFFKLNFELINLKNIDQYLLRDLIIKKIIEEKKDFIIDSFLKS